MLTVLKNANNQSILFTHCGPNLKAIYQKLWVCLLLKLMSRKMLINYLCWIKFFLKYIKSAICVRHSTKNIPKRWTKNKKLLYVFILGIIVWNYIVSGFFYWIRTLIKSDKLCFLLCVKVFIKFRNISLLKLLKKLTRLIFKYFM